MLTHKLRAWTWATVTDTHLEMTESDDIWWWIRISVTHHSMHILLSDALLLCCAGFLRCHFIGTVFLHALVGHCVLFGMFMGGRANKKQNKMPILLAMSVNGSFGCKFLFNGCPKIEWHTRIACVRIWVMCGEGLPRWNWFVHENTRTQTPACLSICTIVCPIARRTGNHFVYSISHNALGIDWLTCVLFLFS